MCGAVKNSLLQGPYCFPVIFPFFLITLGMVLRHLMGTSSIDSGLTDYFFRILIIDRPFSRILSTDVEEI